MLAASSRRDAHRLRDLHHLAAGERAEHAPLAGRRCATVAKPSCAVLRQPALRLREVDLDAVAVPDLHDQRIVAGAGARPGAPASGMPVSEAAICRELVVEERVRLVARAQVGRDRGGDDGDGEARPRASTTSSRRIDGADVIARRTAARDHPAHAAHVADRVGAELAAQRVQVHFDRVALDLVVPAVEPLLELRARQDGAGPRRAAPRAARTRAADSATGAPCDAHLARRRIELDAPPWRAIGCGAAGAAAQRARGCARRARRARTA